MVHFVQSFLLLTNSFHFRIVAECFFFWCGCTPTMCNINENNNEWEKASRKTHFIDVTLLVSKDNSVVKWRPSRSGTIASPVVFVINNVATKSESLFSILTWEAEHRLCIYYDKCQWKQMHCDQEHWPDRHKKSNGNKL